MNTKKEIQRLQELYNFVKPKADAMEAKYAQEQKARVIDRETYLEVRVAREAMRIRTEELNNALKADEDN